MLLLRAEVLAVSETLSVAEMATVFRIEAESRAGIAWHFLAGVFWQVDEGLADLRDSDNQIL